MSKYEYGILAKYYDKLYNKKDYENESQFLNCILAKYNVKNILDAGCGTGSHMKLLEQKNYLCTGLDISNDMLSIAKNKVKGSLYQGNIMDFNLNTKYDAIISMYAVFNHLINQEDAIKTLKNFAEHLRSNGIVIIDLHNPITSGIKYDVINGIERKMKWDYNIKTRMERTSITYNIDNKLFKDTHIFRIYDLKAIKKFAEIAGFDFISAYENYDINKNANPYSKNIQVLLKKSI